MSLKGRHFSIILYTDTKSYNTFDMLQKLEDFTIKHKGNYFYIVHDCDIKENGEEDAEHIHFIIDIPSKDINGKSISDITLESILKLGVDTQHVNKIDGSRYNILYLAHQSPNSHSKYSYDWHSISTNNDKKLRSIFENDEEQRNIYVIIDYIDNSSYLSFIEFSKFILNNNLWSYYRRSGAIINGLIKEHNGLFINDNHIDKTI